MSSTFVRRRGRGGRPANLRPRGAKASAHTTQLLVSTGSADLDVLLGGGVPVGTLTCVVEDIHTTYASNVVKYSLAEAVAWECPIAVVSADRDPLAFAASVPQKTRMREKKKKNKSKGGGSGSGSESGSKLKIAWQYEKYLDNDTLEGSASGEGEGPPATTYCNLFDLGSSVGADALHPNSLFRSIDSLDDPKELFGELAHFIETNTEAPDTGPAAIVRIALPEFGSPLWAQSESGTPEMLQFLRSLRSVLRMSRSRSGAVAVLSFPAHLYTDSFVRRVYHVCDVVVGLRSFAGSPELNSAPFRDYHGFFDIHKAPTLNSLCGPRLDTRLYTFKQMRRELVVDKLHLPPEGESEASEPAASSKKSKRSDDGAGVGGGGGGGGGGDKGKGVIAGSVADEF